MLCESFKLAALFGVCCSIYRIIYAIYLTIDLMCVLLLGTLGRIGCAQTFCSNAMSMSNREQHIEALEQMQEKILELQAHLRSVSGASVELGAFTPASAGDLEKIDDGALQARIGEAAMYSARLEAQVQNIGAAKPMARLGIVCIVLGFVVFLLVGLMFLLKYM